MGATGAHFSKLSISLYTECPLSPYIDAFLLLRMPLNACNPQFLNVSCVCATEGG